MTSPATTSPRSAGPASPEPLPDATSPTGDSSLTCGGRTFPAAGLNAATGAESASGPEFDALRATFKLAGFAGASGWRLAGRDATGAIFLARTEAFGPAGWVSVEVTAGPNGWQPGGFGQCNLRVVLSADYGPASWALNPAFPAPAPADSTLEILVWESACSGGALVMGRMSAPVIQYSASTVTITIGVRPLPAGPHTCPLGPGTPASLRLSEPLGNRTILDGDFVPPAAPSPPFG